MSERYGRGVGERWKEGGGKASLLRLLHLHLLQQGQLLHQHEAPRDEGDCPAFCHPAAVRHPEKPTVADRASEDHDQLALGLADPLILNVYDPLTR